MATRRFLQRGIDRLVAVMGGGESLHQRRLGLEIRDIYGRLIDGSLGATGRLRTGGDGGSIALQASPPKEKLVAFFSGPVKLDAEGKANVSFDIPQ